MKVIGLLQARTSSTRLPGKVLMRILCEPMILHQLRRIKRCRLIHDIIVCTSVESSDDELAKVCSDAGYQVFRGSLDDVLDRFVSSLDGKVCDQVVRLTGDCPLTDSKIIDEIIQKHLDNDVDYTSNSLCPTYPDGLDVEVFKITALLTAWKDAVLPSHREHATPYIYSHPELFELQSVEAIDDLSYMRWTVDEPADFEFVTQVFEHLYPLNAAFGMGDVVDFLKDRSDIVSINSGIARNEGLKKSELADEDFLNKLGQGYSDSV